MSVSDLMPMSTAGPLQTFSMLANGSGELGASIAVGGVVCTRLTFGSGASAGVSRQFERTGLAGDEAGGGGNCLPKRLWSNLLRQLLQLQLLLQLYSDFFPNSDSCGSSPGLGPEMAGIAGITCVTFPLYV